MTIGLHARARQMRERALIRSWEYRQRNLSKGVWFRLRRVLTDAEQAIVVSKEQAEQLERQGHIPLPVGEELEPKKRIFMLEHPQLSNLSTVHSLPVRLSRELLDAPDWVLIRFAIVDAPTRTNSA